MLPLQTPTRQVPAEWIDYNGHMNVAYYTMAFDNALDVILERDLKIGATYVETDKMGPYVIQNHITYISEMLEGESFMIDLQILDADQKRIHIFMRMFKADELIATSEQMMMNVDLTTRRSAPYPDWAQKLVFSARDAHAGMDKPAQVGAAIGIRRKATQA